MRNCQLTEDKLSNDQPSNDQPSPTPDPPQTPEPNPKWPPPHLEDIGRVLDALAQPGVQQVLHGGVACPVVQRGEETQADGAGHQRGHGHTPACLVKGLEEEEEDSQEEDEDSQEDEEEEEEEGFKQENTLWRLLLTKTILCNT